MYAGSSVGSMRICDCSSGTVECEAVVGDESSKVCASDGTTYASDCLLNSAICTNKTLEKLSDGECPKGLVKSTSSPSSPSQNAIGAPSANSSSSTVDRRAADIHVTVLAGIMIAVAGSSI